MANDLKEHGIRLREKMYQFIVDYISENLYAPTIREICDAVNLKSTMSGYSHLVQLEKDGMIELKAKSPRAIKIIGYEFRKKVEE